MPQIGKQGVNPYLHQPIPKNKIERAIQENESKTKAAQSLHVAYNTFKKYAKQYDLWKPLESNAGISRTKNVSWNGTTPLDKEIEFQKHLTKEFILPQRCSCCGESRQRKSDMLSPLIVHFIDGDIQNRQPSNLRFFCYNCYFTSIGDIFNDKQIEGMEDHKPLNNSESDWELDDYTKQRLAELGLGSEPDDDELDIISRL